MRVYIVFEHISSTAWHEAGHALADIHYKLGFRRAELIDDPESHVRGQVFTRPRTTHPAFIKKGDAYASNRNRHGIPQKAFDQLTMLAAGHVAENLMGFGDTGADGDWQQSCELLRGLDIADDQHRQIIHAAQHRATLFLRKRFIDLYLIADALEARRALSRSEVAELIA